MAGQRAASVLAMALVAGVFASIPTEVHSIGVCNGRRGDPLPSGADVVQLYHSNRIAAMRIYEPDDETLRALDGTTIDLIMDVGNRNLAALASDPAAASAWVRDNVQPHQGVRIKYIAVGNEVTGGDTQSILPAMKNLNDALAAAGRSNIKVSTAVKMDVLGDNSSPPSNGVFRDAYMAPIVELLASSGAPLLANVYTYFAYKGDQSIDLNFALLQQSSTTVNDNNGLTYTNLFDAMVDAVYAAMEKAGGPGVPIVVSESGWPSAGGIQASADNARTYNQNLIDHVSKGTPKRPGPLETYIFAMFNENQKEGDETERNFGLFNGRDQSPVYPISF